MGGTMANQPTKIPDRNRACANDSAIWIQRDAVSLKGRPESEKANPFIQPQASSNQPSINPVASADSKKK
jgi:hypothetical protein